MTGHWWQSTVQPLNYPSLVSFLNVTFNFALPFHMEACTKLVITCCTEVRSLIKAMCSEHYMSIFHVRTCGNQSMQWPTHGHQLGMMWKHRGQHLLTRDKYWKQGVNVPKSDLMFDFLDLLWRKSPLHHSFTTSVFLVNAVIKFCLSKRKTFLNNKQWLFDDIYDVKSHFMHTSWNNLSH